MQPNHMIQTKMIALLLVCQLQASAQIMLTETPAGNKIIHIESGHLYMISATNFKPLQKFSIGTVPISQIALSPDGSGIMLLQEAVLNYYQLESGKLMRSHSIKDIRPDDYHLIPEFEFQAQNKFRAIILAENNATEITWNINSTPSTPVLEPNPKSYRKREESFNAFFGELYQKESQVDSAGIPMPPTDFNIVASIRDLKRKKIIQIQSRNNTHQLVRYSFDENFAVKPELKKEMNFFEGTGIPLSPATKLVASELFVVGYNSNVAYLFSIDAETLSLKKQIPFDDSYLKYSSQALVIGNSGRLYGITYGESVQVTILDGKTGKPIHSYSVDTKFSP